MEIGISVVLSRCWTLQLSFELHNLRSQWPTEDMIGSLHQCISECQYNLLHFAKMIYLNGLGNFTIFFFFLYPFFFFLRLCSMSFIEIKRYEVLCYFWNSFPSFWKVLPTPLNGTPITERSFLVQVLFYRAFPCLLGCDLQDLWFCGDNTLLKNW